MKFTCDTNVLVDVLRDPSAEQAFNVFLSRFSHHLWAIPLEGDRKPFEVVRTEFNESFVMQSVVGDAHASPISLILNWKPGR